MRFFVYDNEDDFILSTECEATAARIAKYYAGYYEVEEIEQ